MPNGSERIRAEVVGSLLRPRHLIGARRALEHATINAAEFKETEDRAVDQAIALQEAIGLDVLTDGELRRSIFTGPLTESVEGLEHVPGVKRTWYTADGPIEEDLPLVVTSGLRLRRSSATEEFSYARARARRRLKVTLPTPVTATPADKTVVLGLVSTKTATIEPIAAIIERIREAAAYVPLERLALSTQCGFASMIEAHPELTEDVQAAKLELVVQAAEQVWKD